MVESVFLSALLAGMFSSNVVASSGVGIELGTNNLNGIKNSFVYSLIVLVTSIVSSALLFLVSYLLEIMEVETYFFVAALLMVAVIVQLAEYTTKKCLPLFFTQTKYFVPSIVSSLFVILICAFTEAKSFGSLLLIVVAEGLGTMLVLATVAGIRRSITTTKNRPILNGNLLSLVVLLFIMLTFTAF